MVDERLEPEQLDDVVGDDAIFVILDEGNGDTLRIYQDGSVLMLDRDGCREATPTLNVIVNRLREVIDAAGQLGFDEAIAMMEAEKKRRRGETIAEYVVRINKQAAEERRQWAEAEKASTGETRAKGTPKKRG